MVKTTGKGAVKPLVAFNAEVARTSAITAINK
jgi:hypothetical protein